MTGKSEDRVSSGASNIKLPPLMALKGSNLSYDGGYSEEISDSISAVGMVAGKLKHRTMRDEKRDKKVAMLLEVYRKEKKEETDRTLLRTDDKKKVQRSKFGFSDSENEENDKYEEEYDKI